MSNVFILGDIHGCVDPICKLINNQDIPRTKEDILILLGDVGANFYLNDKDNTFKKNMCKYDLTLFCIRGNHEERPEIMMEKNPNKWHMETFWDNEVYVENDYPNIKYALDEPAIYSITLNNITIKALVVPGAYSIDKNNRLQYGGQWFYKEQLTIDEMKKGYELIQNNHYDVVLSHTCPLSMEPIDLFLNGVDRTLVDKSMEQYLEKVLQNTIAFGRQSRFWFFGHFHQFRIYKPVSSIQPIMLFNDIVINLNECWDSETKQQLLYSCYSIK